MRCWLSTGGVSLALAALLAAGVELPSAAQTNVLPRGVPLQFSGRADVTNVFESGEMSEGLETLQDGLFGPLRQVQPGGSMQGLPPAVRLRRAVPSRETREILDRKRNWVFASPESLPGGPDPSDSSTNLEELQKAGKLTAVEQYYLELSRQQNAPDAVTEQQRGMDGVHGPTLKVPDAIREREDELKRLLMTEADDHGSRDADLTARSPQRGGVSMSGSALTFRPAAPGETRKESPVDTYRQMLGLPASSVELADIFRSPNALQEREPARAPTAPASSPRAVLPTPSWNTPVTQPGQVPSAPTVAEAPRLNPALGPAGSVLKPETPQRTPPPAPTFTAPRRLF